MTYEQAYKDHCYLWETYGPAVDMTGGYIDSDDLDKLLASPTKKTAKECLENQIHYWFEIGPDEGQAISSQGRVLEICKSDPKVQDIADRHFIEVLP